MGKRKNEDAQEEVPKKVCKESSVDNSSKEELEKILIHKSNRLLLTGEFRCHLPRSLLRLMYQIDLMILLLHRKSRYKNKYSLLKLKLGNTTTEKFNCIVLSYERKDILVIVDYVDEYYIEDCITYSKLFSVRSQDFSLNRYFNMFIKYFISEYPSSRNIEYFVIFTNLNLDLTREQKIKEWTFQNSYPFQFERLTKANGKILHRFFHIMDKEQNTFYRFSKDRETKQQLMKRLEFFVQIENVLSGKNFPVEFRRQIKEAFIDNLVFIVNQPRREELHCIVTKEVQKNVSYDLLYRKVIHEFLIEQKHYKSYNIVSECLYNLNLLISLLHSMFLCPNLQSVNFITGENYISNDIIINYRGRISYIRVFFTCNIIHFSLLFPSGQRKKEKIFSMNELFKFYAESLGNDIRFFIIYTGSYLDLTIKNTLKSGQSKNFRFLLFDKIDKTKKKYKVLRNCLCIDSACLYRFSESKTTRQELLNLLELPLSVKQGCVSVEDEMAIKENFLRKLIFATDQPRIKQLESSVRNDIEEKCTSSKIPYNYQILLETTLRWSESHDFGAITKKLLQKFFDDIKYNRSSHKILQKNIDKEIKLAKCLIEPGTYLFDTFLGFLIEGKGKEYFQYFLKNKVNPSHASSILTRTYRKSEQAFIDLCNVWFDDQGMKSHYLKTLDKEGMNLSTLSNLIRTSRSNGAHNFKCLYDLWFDKEGKKSIYLQTLDKQKISLKKISAILSGSASFAPGAFLNFYHELIDEEGNKKSYFRNMEEKGVNFSVVSTMLTGSGVGSIEAFRKLYKLWFDEKGEKRKCLITLENHGIDLLKISYILTTARASAPEAFENLYNAWFDEQGNKRKQFQMMESHGVGFSNISSLLKATGCNALKTFRELYEVLFDEQGNKTQLFKNFIEHPDGKNFTLISLCSILCMSVGKTKIAFEKLHNVCFDEEGKRTNILNDFYKVGFKPYNLSCILIRTGVRAYLILTKLHSIFFNGNGENSKLLNDFLNAGFKPSNITSFRILKLEDLIDFHSFLFLDDTKCYLGHFIKEGFHPELLSKIFHRVQIHACESFEELHKICFNIVGERRQVLNDFFSVGFDAEDLVGFLKKNRHAASTFKSFHDVCFDKVERMKHFLAEKDIFSTKILSKIIQDLRLKLPLIFKKLHDLCFDRSGNRTNYLDELIRSKTQTQITTILYREIRKPSFLS